MALVGIGAVKYNDLSKDRQTLVTFTWDKALSLSGNTAGWPEVTTHQLPLGFQMALNGYAITMKAWNQLKNDQIQVGQKLYFDRSKIRAARSSAISRALPARFGSFSPTATRSMTMRSGPEIRWTPPCERFGSTGRVWKAMPRRGHPTRC